MEFMKKLRHLLLTTSVLCFLPSAWALKDANFNGEMGISSQVHFLPTADKGNTAFLFPSFKLWGDIPLKDENAIEVLFEGAEKREANSKRFFVQLKEAYLDLSTIFSEVRGIRAGLIPNSWQESQKEIWNYEFIGTTGKSFTEKYGYMSHSDLGLMYTAPLAEQNGEWSFAVVNGQGMEADETGPRKEAQLFLRWVGMSPFNVSVGYVYGSYDQYESSLAKKERILLQMDYSFGSGLMIGLELMDAHDPADVFSVASMAQNVDVSTYAGKNINGQGASLFAKYLLNEKSDLVMRYEHLQVISGNPDKLLKSVWLGYSYELTESVDLLASDYYMWLSDKYGNGTRDVSNFQIAARISF